MSSSPGLLDHIMERRKRAALGDLSNGTDTTTTSGRRTRARMEISTPGPSNEEESGDKVAVQRFTLVSRGAPPAKRAPPKESVLVAPPRVAAQLGSEVQVCRCSDCDRTGLKRRMSGTRVCRRDTESHPEYAMLLLMSERFTSECSDRAGSNELVTEACCREKTAYFILGAGSTTVGYVAAEVQANRKVKSLNDSLSSGVCAEQVTDSIPTLVQVYVEPEFRGRGYASEAVRLLMREHECVRVDDPSASVVRMLARLDYAPTRTEETDDGQVLTTFMRTSFLEFEP